MARERLLRIIYVVALGMAFASACASTPQEAMGPQVTAVTSSTAAPQTTTTAPQTTSEQSTPSRPVGPTDRVDIRWARERFDLIVFFDAGATEAEIMPVFEQLDPLSSELVWLSQEETSVEFADTFVDDPLVEPVPDSLLPPSYRAILWEPPEKGFVAELAELPGVREVLLPKGSHSVSVDYDITVFFDSTASSSEIAAVEAELTPIANDIVFVSQEQTYEEFLQLFAAEEGLAEATDPSEMPPSFRVNVDVAIDAATLYRISLMPGVTSLIPPPGSPAP